MILGGKLSNRGTAYLATAGSGLAPRRVADFRTALPHFDEAAVAILGTHKSAKVFRQGQSVEGHKWPCTDKENDVETLRDVSPAITTQNKAQYGQEPKRCPAASSSAIASLSKRDSNGDDGYHIRESPGKQKNCTRY